MTRRFSVLAAILLTFLGGCSYFWVEPYGEIARDVKPIREDGRQAVLPENAPSISQGYSAAPDDYGSIGAEKEHYGIDIIGETGTPVLAPAAGVVIKSYFEPMSGHHIEMELGRDEKGRYIKAIFVHLKERMARKGDIVSRGQQIGTLGSTGILAAGLPHLHFTILAGNEDYIYEPVNPHWFWADGIGLVTCFDSSRTWPETPFKTTYPVPCKGINWQ